MELEYTQKDSLERMADGRNLPDLDHITLCFCVVVRRLVYTLGNRRIPCDTVHSCKSSLSCTKMVHNTRCRDHHSNVGRAGYMVDYTVG